MRQYEIQQKMNKATDLLRHRRFGDALNILEELDAEKPGDRNLTYWRIQALTGLRRYDEARVACDYLVQDLKDDRGKQLKQQIEAQERGDLALKEGGRAKSGGAAGKLIFILILFAVAGAGAYWYFMMR